MVVSTTNGDSCVVDWFKDDSCVVDWFNDDICVVDWFNDDSCVDWFWCNAGDWFELGGYCVWVGEGWFCIAA